LNEWINAYYDEARVKSVSVLDKNNYYVQTEIDCIGIENKNSTSSIRITTYIICSLVCIGIWIRRRRRRKKNDDVNKRKSMRILSDMPDDYEWSNEIFKEILFLRHKANFTDELIQYLIFLSRKKKDFFS
jgi:hypothetical protein